MVSTYAAPIFSIVLIEAILSGLHVIQTGFILCFINKSFIRKHDFNA